MSKKNVANSNKNVLTLADLGSIIETDAPTVDMSGTLAELGSIFQLEFSAIEKANEKMDYAASIEDKAKMVNIKLNELRTIAAGLKRIVEQAQYAVDKAFSENEDLRRKGIWMRANARSIEWDKEIDAQKEKAVARIVGDDYGLYVTKKSKIAEGMKYLVELDNTARAAYAEAEQIKRDAGFSTK